MTSRSSSDGALGRQDEIVRDTVKPSFITPNEAAAEVEALLAALKPFADLAGPINGEEGRRSEISVITDDGDYDELELRSHVAASRRSVILDAADFRVAKVAYDKACAVRLSRPTPEAEVEAVARIIDPEAMVTAEELAEDYRRQFPEWPKEKVREVAQFAYDAGKLQLARRDKALTKARAILSRSPGGDLGVSCRPDPKSIDAGTEAASGRWLWTSCPDASGRYVASFDITMPAEPGARGVAVIASVWGNEAHARVIAEAQELLWFAQQIRNAYQTGMLDSPADETLANVMCRGIAAIDRAAPPIRDGEVQP